MSTSNCSLGVQTTSGIITTSSTSSITYGNYDNYSTSTGSVSLGNIVYDSNTGIDLLKDFQDQKCNFKGDKMTIKPSYLIKSVKEIVPDKVFEFTFDNGEKVKTIRQEMDLPDIEYVVALAISKHIYGKTLTLEGVLFKVVSEIFLMKAYQKEIRHGVKLIKDARAQAAAALEAEKKEKERKKKLIEKKKLARKRKQEEKLRLLKDILG